MNLKKYHSSHYFSLVWHAVILISFPLAEILFLRIFLHSYIQVRLSWAYITDFDLLIPGVVAFITFVGALSQEEKIKFQFSQKAFLLNLFFAGTFLSINFLFDSIAVFSPDLCIILWLVNFSAVFITAFVVFTPLSFYCRNSNRHFLLPSLLILFAPLFSRRILMPVWPFFSKITGESVCFVLQSTETGVTCLYSTFHEPRIIIKHALQAISVGRGCAGLDSFFLFFYLSLVLCALNDRILHWGRWLLFFLSGVLTMFFANVLRIALFFHLSVFLKRWTSLGSESVVANLFHLHAGWFIYLISFAGLFKFFLLWESAYKEKSLERVVRTDFNGWLEISRI